MFNVQVPGCLFCVHIRNPNDERKPSCRADRMDYAEAFDFSFLISVVKLLLDILGYPRTALGLCLLYNVGSSLLQAASCFVHLPPHHARVLLVIAEQFGLVCSIGDDQDAQEPSIHTANRTYMPPYHDVSSLLGPPLLQH